MTTASQAFTAVKNRLTGSASVTGISIDLRWQGEDGGELPDTPEAFAYVVFDNRGSRPGPASFGGGRGANRYRNQVMIEAFVFAPNGEGIKSAMDHAETIAARLRSFRDSDISIFNADVMPVGDGASMAPPGLQSEVNNYICAMVEAPVEFDQVG